MAKLIALLIMGQVMASLAAEPALDIKALLTDSGVKGGLCIAAGIDVAGGRTLANSSKLYVQLVAPDDQTALSWLRLLEASQDGASMTVVNHRMNPLPYTRDVANLILVNGAANVPSAAEINRVLTPGGTAAIIGAPAVFMAEAEKLGLTKVNSSAALILRKPRLPASEDWGNLAGGPALGASIPNSTLEPAMSLRWRTGPRWQSREYNYDALAAGGGVLVYREIQLVPGTIDQFKRVLVARDAFNGRELWQRADAKVYSRPLYGFNFTPLLAAGEGRICVSIDGNMSCLDAASGEILYTLDLSKSARTVTIYRKYLVFSCDGAVLVYSLADGKPLWSKPVTGKASAVPIKDEALFLTSGKVITAHRLDTGAELWTAPTDKDEHPELDYKGRLFCTGVAVNYTKSSKEKTYVFALDLKTGRALWTSEIENPKTVFPGFKDMSEGISIVAFDDELWGYFNKRAPDRGYTVHLTCIDARTGEIKKKNYSMHNGSTHCWSFKGAGHYLLYAKNQFVDRRDMSETVNGLVRSICGVGHIPAERELIMLPHNCRCGTLIRGVLAMGAPDKAYDIEKSGVPVLTPMEGRYSPLADTPNDWPMFRGTQQRSSSRTADIGTDLKKKWEVQVGGVGLSPVVSAYGMAFLSDGEKQRILGLDVESGAVKWTFPAGARVSYPPSLYKGVCLFGTTEGMVYGLDARTGAPLWKLQVAPEECFMGSQERFESRWPVVGDVLIQNGVGYVSAGRAGTIDGGVQVVAFDPVTGKVAWNKAYTNAVSADLLVGTARGDGFMMNAKLLNPATRVLSTGSAEPAGSLNVVLRSLGGVGAYTAIDDYLMSTDRLRISARREKLGDLRINGINVAFMDKLSVASVNAPCKTPQELLGPFQRLVAMDAPKKVKWDLPAVGMRVDGLVLTPEKLYWVGGSPTDDPKVDSVLQVWAANDGNRLASLSFGDRAVSDGLSMANGHLFIVTRSGKVLCYQGEKEK